MKKGLATEFRRRRASSGAQRVADKKIATITLHRVADMTDEGRGAIADWLRKQAAFVETDGANMAASYTARYFAR